MSWLSPVFPIGGFAYSAGLEQAARAGLVRDRAGVSDWIAVQVTRGAAWNDAVILIRAQAEARDAAALDDLASLCLALCVGQERHDETLNQGVSFLEAVRHWVASGRLPGGEVPLPVAVGAAAGVERIAAVVERIEPRLLACAYLHGFVSNQLQCAIRLSLLGQDGAARVLSDLEPVIDAAGERAAGSTLDDLGGAAFICDSAAMRHETLQPRLFLS
ncbi:hypothetical protein AWJ14_05955 [Hoeflea olei]|uniref:Urease accessory protein UreF n=2 Tax=Hoeflea olei TaxID=1480615 RepID=A0A1C1YQ91_9HYPH|nr:hypothetical protein AWJ14_05955 [Hoeflea olei]